jgi:hypothetical protein
MVKFEIFTWHSLIGFCVVSVFGWLFCFTLLSRFAEKTSEIANLMRENDAVAKSMWKWSYIGAIALGVLWVVYDVAQR